MFYMDGMAMRMDDEYYNRLRYFLTGVPFIGDVLRTQDDYNYVNDYMKNRGLSWSDVRYPSHLSGASGFGHTLNYVSSNIERLYK